MNERQRGIAAYKAVSGAAKEQKGKGGRGSVSRSKGGEAEEALPLKVTVDIRAKKKPAAETRSKASGSIPLKPGRVDQGASSAGHPQAAKTGRKGGGAATPSSGAKGGGASAASGSAPSRSVPAPVAQAEASPEELLKAEAGSRGYRKVAKFLLLLGQDEAAKILRHFTADEIEGISREIARIRTIDASEAKGLLHEFGVERTKRHAVKAGPETARAMLLAAFGEERGKALFRRVVPEGIEAPFQFLNDISYEQILLLLKNESAPTVAIILPYLKAKIAAQVLEHLPSDLQKEVIRRIAKIERVDQEVIARMEGLLKERIRSQGTVVTQEIDGRSALADILKHMDLSSEERIIENLADFDPELSKDVKDRVFTIELLLKIDDAELQSVLRDYDDREIATILKGKEEPIYAKIMKNISSRRAEMISEEMSVLGKMRRTDVDRATKEFLDYLIELDEQRKITIHWDDGLV